MAGDALGLVLQIAALATGPVVLVQPLLVLALPISLPISRPLGGPRPTRGDFVSCALIIPALGAFFVILRNPGDASILTVRPALITIGVDAGRRRDRGRRGARPAAGDPGARSTAWSPAPGPAWSACCSTRRPRPGPRTASARSLHSDGLVPLVGLLVVGALSIVLTQVALQIGELGASFPASLSADPVIAVVLGAALLRETVPTAPLAGARLRRCASPRSWPALSDWRARPIS